MSRQLILALLISLSVHTAAIMQFGLQGKQTRPITMGSIRAPVNLTLSTVAVPGVAEVIEETKPESQHQQEHKKRLPAPQPHGKPLLKQPKKTIEEKHEEAKPEKIKKQTKERQEIPEQKLSTKTAITKSEMEGLSNEPMPISHPTIINQVPPKYPRRCLRRNLEGIVDLELLINQQGQVININILKSSGYRQMDNSAVSAVKQWIFEPGQDNGHIVTSRIQQRIVYKIN